MTDRRRISRISTFSIPIALLAVQLFAFPAEAIQLQIWGTVARIMSGNTTLVESPDPGTPSGPDDSTGFLEANGANLSPPGPIDTGSVTTYGLSNGTIGVATGFDALSNFPIDNRIFDTGGTASANYFDDLTIISSTLPVGTPVTVRFAFDLGFSSGAASTLNEANTSAQISSTAAGVQGLLAADNRYFDDLAIGLFIQNGLFTPPYQADYTISAQVGETISLNIQVRASSSGTVFFTGSLGNEVNNAANGWGSVGVSFGGEVVGADAQLVSGVLGGPFPAASQVSPAAAQAAIPINPFDVPEPGAMAMLLAGGLALITMRRRSASAPERPRAISGRAVRRAPIS